VLRDLHKRGVLLLGPRRTGKTALLRNEVRADRTYNLLHADVFQRLSARPWLIREELGPSDQLVAIDEIQKLPVLMDEVHSLIEERGVRFLLTGSSARKLRRTHTSLMAGRARTRHLHPLVSAETPSWDLDRALLTGTLPPVYLADDPWEELASYVGEYLHEEIRAEALARRVESFSRFLHTAALTNAQVVNFEGVARDAQVPARTVREYYQLLEDTLLGYLVEPMQTRTDRPSRKAVSRAKFYLFDLGVLHALLGRRALPDGSDDHGRAFETLIALELLAWRSYEAPLESVRYFRTRDGVEVDFVIGDHTAIEVKATKLAQERHARGLLVMQEVHPMRRRILVTRDPHPRSLHVRGVSVQVLPCREFLVRLWDGELRA
jgi:predicted AAA+ superfamily ATPase